eukprot:CAMPEP_0116963900 /NCGR_PEP_ID=MMETSP0467-20121206/48218_1 /TAXON_ID=283647 /ORGANISM="Mesodinium pulex, Strain SPMC105" /LENGTH=108 /DNA_ID=CAMNT_0004652681 /DNA_START=172 /DNA_END=498 /DNA_ORIENTATION=+
MLMEFTHLSRSHAKLKQDLATIVSVIQSKDQEWDAKSLMISLGLATSNPLSLQTQVEQVDSQMDTLKATHSGLCRANDIQRKFMAQIDTSNIDYSTTLSANKNKNYNN